jgi:hypothetical protein
LASRDIADLKDVAGVDGMVILKWALQNWVYFSGLEWSPVARYLQFLRSYAGGLLFSKVYSLNDINVNGEMREIKYERDKGKVGKEDG